MDGKNEPVRVANDDPKRCQGMTKNGQCQMMSTRDLYCAFHSSNFKKENLYRLTTLQHRVNELRDNPNALSLRSEIAILRLNLETILNKCPTELEILMYTPQISKLANDINSVVTNAHKLESKLGDLLDRKAVIAIADGIIQVVSQYITSEDDLKNIATAIADIIEFAAIDRQMVDA